MAVVAIANIYNPLVFEALENEAQLELNKFISSGVAIQDPMLESTIAVGGNIGELTNFNPLGTPEPNYSNDNPATLSTPYNIDKAIQRYRLATQNNSWSTMNIARELALKDPVMAITSKIGQYWATINEKRLIQSCLGILADNILSDASDMLKTVATDVAAPVVDAERISANVIIDAQQTMGDHASSLTAIAMHSAPFARLKKQNLIAFIPNSRGEVNIPTYLGLTVIVDDSLPAIMGVNRITYTCILFGSSVFGVASGRVLVPSELFRIPSAGNGGGQDLIFSRRNDLLHPLGFSFTSSSVAGQSATLAELALAANWDRKWSRKNLPIAFLRVND